MRLGGWGGWGSTGRVSTHTHGRGHPCPPSPSSSSSSSLCTQPDVASCIVSGTESGRVLILNPTPLPYLPVQPDAVSSIVLGTESGRVLILNPAGTGIVKNIWLGVTPAFMAVQVRRYGFAVQVGRYKGHGTA